MSTQTEHEGKERMFRDLQKSFEEAMRAAHAKRPKVDGELEKAFSRAYQKDSVRRFGPEGEIAYSLGFIAAIEQLTEGGESFVAKGREACAKWESVLAGEEQKDNEWPWSDGEPIPYRNCVEPHDVLEQTDLLAATAVVLNIMDYSLQELHRELREKRLLGRLNFPCVDMYSLIFGGNCFEPCPEWYHDFREEIRKHLPPEKS